MTVKDLLGSGFVTVQNLSNTEDYVTDGNVTNGGPLGPSPCDDESGLLYFVILVLVIFILMACCLRYCGWACEHPDVQQPPPQYETIFHPPSQPPPHQECQQQIPLVTFSPV